MKFKAEIIGTVDAVQVAPGCYNDMVKLFGEEPGDKYGYINGTMHPYTEPKHGLISANNKYRFEMWFRDKGEEQLVSFGDWIIKSHDTFLVCEESLFPNIYKPTE